MTSPERSPERDAAIDAVLPIVPRLGWTVSAMREALSGIGVPREEATLLFPGGARDMIETHCDLADRRMEAEAAARHLEEWRLSERVRAVIALRFEQNRTHKEAVRRAAAILALPANARLAARVTARTVNAMWHACGDTSADFSWYTKRATLAAIYGATLLVWLRDVSDDDAPTLAFLDRRLAGLARFGRLRRRLRHPCAPCRRERAEAA
jgi:ubiquinone biosynthesis protein COQ9